MTVSFLIEIKRQVSIAYQTKGSLLTLFPSRTTEYCKSAAIESLHRTEHHPDNARMVYGYQCERDATND